MALSRRRYLFASAAMLLTLGVNGCSYAASETTKAINKDGKTIVYVVGTIHSDHLDSTDYSLAILERAIRKANPDQIIAEIPPDRLAEAWRGFRKNGVVSEPRVRIFPEYRDVIFPLSKSMKFEIVPAAGWTQQLSDYRDKALNRISKDPARAAQWRAHQTAQAAYSRAVGARDDDPLYIHTAQYDALVKAAQNPYETYFEEDLGQGGWKTINAAHIRLINKALDRISGQEKTVWITFGSWHKYMILKDLMTRKDVILADSRSLFQ